MGMSGGFYAGAVCKESWCVIYSVHKELLAYSFFGSKLALTVPILQYPCTRLDTITSRHMTWDVPLNKMKSNDRRVTASPLLMQDHKGIVMEQPSILGLLRTPTAGVEPIPPDRLTGLRSYSPSSPTEERSPDALSSASEATETG